MILLEQGCINIWIDEIVPCLKNTKTGEIKETVVFKIQSRAYLKEFQKSNGWHINWNELPRNVDVYALALKEDNSIQGLVGIKMIKIPMQLISIGPVLLHITINMNMISRNMLV